EVNAMPAQPPVIPAMVVPPPRTRVEASAEIDQPGPPDPPVAVADDMPAGDDVSAGNVARGPSRRAAVGIPPRLAGLARRPPGGPVCASCGPVCAPRGAVRPVGGPLGASR